MAEHMIHLSDGKPAAVPARIAEEIATLRAQLAEAHTRTHHLRFNIRTIAQELMALANEDNQEKPDGDEE